MSAHIALIVPTAKCWARKRMITPPRPAAKESPMTAPRCEVPLPHTRSVTPWNKGRFVGPKPPLKPKQVWAIRSFLQREQRVRDLALFDVAIDSKLRGCDLVKLRIGNLVVNGQARQRAMIVQQKTNQPVQFELTDQTRESLIIWPTRRAGSLDNFAFPSRVDYTPSQNPPVRPARGEWGRSDRPLSLGVRHPQPAQDQGRPDLQANGQPTSRPNPAGAHEAGEHGSLPRR